MTVWESIDPWKVCGWTFNVCYFSRFLVQWWASERARSVVAPRSFWWMSILGVICFTAYSLHKGEPVLFAGGIVNGLIYVRNLMLAYGRGRVRIQPLSATLLAVLATALLFLTGLLDERTDLASSRTWFAISILGQGIWSARFVLQWWLSERAQRADFPPIFWWISLTGNLLLLAYAIHLGDEVYIAGFVLGPIVQIRNLVLSRRGKRGDAAGVAS
jgi:lipid-A-disaccharide synthase-like uncharacterized protein